MNLIDNESTYAEFLDERVTNKERSIPPVQNVMQKKNQKLSLIIKNNKLNVHVHVSTERS